MYYIIFKLFGVFSHTVRYLRAGVGISARSWCPQPENRSGSGRSGSNVKPWPGGPRVLDFFLVTVKGK